MMITEMVELRMWEHLLRNASGTTDIESTFWKSHDEGYALFVAVEAAFATVPDRSFVSNVDPILVQYLAGWCRQTTEGYPQNGGAIGVKRNHFVRRAFRAFVQTIAQAVKYGDIRYVETDRPMFGCLTIPQWFVDICMSDVQEEAERCNQLIEEGLVATSTLHDEKWLFE